MLASLEAMLVRNSTKSVTGVKRVKVLVKLKRIVQWFFVIQLQSWSDIQCNALERAQMQCNAQRKNSVCNPANCLISFDKEDIFWNETSLKTQMHYSDTLEMLFRYIFVCCWLRVLQNQRVERFFISSVSCSILHTTRRPSIHPSLPPLIAYAATSVSDGVFMAIALQLKALPGIELL